jgi:sugar phosphate isomerase/epimerase
MVIALSTGSLHTYGTARIFGLAVEVGYDGVEVMVDHRWDTRQPDYLRRLSGDYNLPVVALHSPFLTLDTPGWSDDALGRLRHTVNLAQALDVPTVVTHLPFRFHALVGRWYAAQQHSFKLPVPIRRREHYSRFLCNGLGSFEAEVGVVVAVENMPAHRFLRWRVNSYAFNSIAEIARFPHLTLDTTHLGTWGMDPLAVYEQLRERIVHVHLSNFDGADKKRPVEHRSPPDGHLPLAELLRRLACDGYRGVITVETSPDALDAEDEKKCLAALRRALAFCREHFCR